MGKDFKRQDRRNHKIGSQKVTDPVAIFATLTTLCITVFSFF